MATELAESVSAWEIVSSGRKDDPAFLKTISGNTTDGHAVRISYKKPLSDEEWENRERLRALGSISFDSSSEAQLQPVPNDEVTVRLDGEVVAIGGEPWKVRLWEDCWKRARAQADRAARAASAEA